MSSLAEQFIAEFELETQSTLRLLEAVPGDKLDWQPHVKSFSLGVLAMHIATSPLGTSQLAASDSLAMESMDFQNPVPSSTEEIVSTFKNGIEETKANIAALSDQEMAKPWTMTMNGQVMFSSTKAGVFRNFTLNHLYHHRGQLQVYLRLLDVPVPSVYGPTADDNPFA